MSARSGGEKRQRTRQVGVRLTDAEFKILGDDAASRGCSLPEVLRLASLGAPVEGTRVTLAEIDAQRAKGWPDFGPEDYCHRCGNRNMSWATPAEVWNPVMRPDGADTTAWLWNEIICPPCFADLSGGMPSQGGESWAVLPWRDHQALLDERDALAARVAAAEAVLERVGDEGAVSGLREGVWELLGDLYGALGAAGDERNT